ncbi:MAG TPA: 2-amino-4-hydroxy-6-hydroxymethyldihydropteridine diphosphokinase, partial [Myxococcota bacterium]
MQALVGLGSSDPRAPDVLVRAVALLRAHPRIELVAASDVVETPAHGGVTRARFLNAAVVVATALSPAALLRELHAIEHACGRVRTASTVTNAARTLDLDVLLVLEQAARPSCSTSSMITPHPRMLARA